MHMKFTNKEMYQSVNVLSNLRETGKLGYAIARNLRKLKAENKEYVDMRDKALQKYGIPDGKKPGVFTLTPEAQKSINAELEEIAELEIDVDVMAVSEDVFCSGGLTSDQMTNLLWMVEEPEEQK